MKKEVVALSLALVLMAGLFAPAYAAESSFTDVPANHWAAEAIQEMVDLGVMTGKGNGQFAPDAVISNAEFLTMIVRRFYPDYITGDGTNQYFNGHWWTPYLYAASKAHILTDGLDTYRTFGDDAFGIKAVRPDDPITRYDMAVILYMTAVDVFGEHFDEPYDLTQVSDYAAIQEYDNSLPGSARKVEGIIEYCYRKGLLSGMGSSGAFSGDSTMTRAQAAVVMGRMIEQKPSETEISDTDAVTPGTIKELTDKDVVMTDGGSYSKGAFTFEYDESRGTDGYNRSPYHVTIDVSGSDFLRITCLNSGNYRIFNGDEEIARSGMFGGSIESNSVADFSTITLMVYPEYESYSSFKFELGTYATVKHSIPADAYELTGANILYLHGDGSKYGDGVFHLYNSGFEGVGGYITFNNPGYTTLTFTVTCFDLEHNVSVVGVDGIFGDGRLSASMKPGETKTYSANISQIGRVEIGVRSGRFCNAEVTNIYLS